MSRRDPPRIPSTRPLPNTGQCILEAAFERQAIELVQWPRNTTGDREWILRQFREGPIDGIVCMLGDKIDEEILEAAGPSLKFVSTMSAGYDHIDTAALKRRGIRLGTTPDALTDATADIGAMLVLMASRRAGEGVRAVADGLWPSMPWAPRAMCGRALQKSTVGVVGFGKIGQLTLKRLLGFGISRALYTTSQPGVALPSSKDHFNLLSNADVPIECAKDLQHLASESDFILITCALTEQTRNLVNADFLRRCKSSAYIINTARGPIVNSEDLVQAVQLNQIAGAGLDVVDGEPNIGADHPLVKEKRIVVLPHIGSATEETRDEMAKQCAQNVLAGLEVGFGDMVHQVVL